MWSVECVDCVDIIYSMTKPLTGIMRYDINYNSAKTCGVKNRKRMSSS